MHCKDGLGRAGTISARLLIELGQTPKEAIEQVRSVRPGAIETPGQVAYARGLSRVHEPEPSREQHAVLDHAIGAMLGLAVGTTLEFKARDSHPLLIHMLRGGPFRLQPGEWTDDTAMSLALAESLLGCGDL